MSESSDRNNLCIGLKERIEFNQDFKPDRHDKDEIRDGYQLKWIGKDYARLQSGMMTETVIIPNNEHNNKEENKNSKNLFFTGDNLEVLRHLQNAYSNSIKMIYIDPPYNTGSEFVYNDTFEFSDEKLKEMLGFTNEEIKRLHTINGRSSHSAWLTFMYPRLKIAKRLLTEDGVIFISIDDNEQANLRLLCDEIFGEVNFIGNIAWESKTKSQNTKTAYNKLQPKIEHIYVYSLSNKRTFNLIQKGKKIYPFEDEYGFYREYPLEVMNANGIRGRETMIYEVMGIIPPEGKQWQLGQDQVAYYKNSGNLFVREGKIIIKMRPEFEDEAINDPFWAFFPKEIGTAESAKKYLNNLMDVDNIFDTVKPLELIHRLLFHSTTNNDIILDFFAGSATTAHAVIQLNSEVNSNRQYIMVQIQEQTKEDSEARKAGFNTIDEISRKRIELSANKIKEETNADIDYGYKHYYVKETDVNTINKIEEFDPTLTKLIADNMVQEFDNEFSKGKDVIFTTWLVADGYKLDKEVEIIDFEGYKAHYIDNSLLYLIDTNWNCNQTKQLLNLIGERKLNINTIVVYGYSFTLESLKELEIAVKQNFDNKIQIEKRY